MARLEALEVEVENLSIQELHQLAEMEQLDKVLAVEQVGAFQTM
jgi:hypothetical protein